MRKMLAPHTFMKSALLTHGGRVKHICVSELTIIGSDKGLSPGRSQAIVWTNAGILLIGPLETNVSENLIAIYTFSFKTMQLKMSSAKWGPFVPVSMREMSMKCCSGGDKSVDLHLYSLMSLLLRQYKIFLNHLPLDNMTAVSQTIFSDEFVLMKSFVFWFDFHWNSFLAITQHCFR